jgi:O-antigen biosynthesis protein WbqP
MSGTSLSTPAPQLRLAALKRAIDIGMALTGLTVGLLPLALVALAVRVTSPGPAIHWSHRIGQFNVLFKMPKFRTMRATAPQLPTHLMATPEMYVTSLGRFLRKTSIDELPQLWSILIGDMSFVGPRPALFSQDDLVRARTEKGVHTLKPGLTGWAQVNGRDEMTIPRKVELDEYYLRHQSTAFDARIMAMTLARVVRAADISH